MKHFALGFVSMCALMAVVTLAYLLFGFADVRADVVKPGWYTSFHAMAVRASVHRRAPASSPLVPADSDLIAGGHSYLNGCAGCHGTPGKKRETHGWFSTPPQFSETAPPYSEPEMYWIIDHGVRRTGMSAYGVFYKDIQMWREAAFLKRINDLPAAVSDSLGLPRAAGK
jgi:mono/diheme cytochrome c family protein